MKIHEMKSYDPRFTHHVVKDGYLLDSFESAVEAIGYARDMGGAVGDGCEHEVKGGYASWVEAFA